MFGTMNTTITVGQKEKNAVFKNFLNQHYFGDKKSLSSSQDEHLKLLEKMKDSIFYHALNNLQMPKGKLYFSVEDENKLTAHLEKMIYFCNGVVTFFPELDLKKVPSNASEEEKIKVHCGNALKYLLIWKEFNPEKVVIDPNLFVPILEKKPKWLAGMRQAVQDAFDHLDLTVLNQFSDDESEQLTLQLASMLTVFMEFDLSKQKSIKLPCRASRKSKQGAWERVEFQIETLEFQLNEKSKECYQNGDGEIEDQNYRIHAYGLIPKLADCERGISPVLLYPNFVQGNAHAKYAQMTAEKSAGETLFIANHANIRDFINTFNGWKSNNNINYKFWVVGSGVGGSFALYTALTYPHLLKRVDCFNSPGIHKSTLENESNPFVWGENQSVVLENKMSYPDVFVHLEKGNKKNDLAYWMPEWTLLKSYHTQLKYGNFSYKESISNWLTHLHSGYNAPGVVALKINTSVQMNNKPSKTVKTPDDDIKKPRSTSVSAATRTNLHPKRNRAFTGVDISNFNKEQQEKISDFFCQKQREESNDDVDIDSSVDACLSVLLQDRKESKSHQSGKENEKKSTSQSILSGNPHQFDPNQNRKMAGKNKKRLIPPTEKPPQPPVPQKKS